MLPIHFRHHVVTVKGQQFKAVTCEHCRGEFVYLLTRHAEGWATGVMFLDRDAPRQAAQEASAELSRELARGQEPVPCPACGWYQQSMLRLLRAQHRGWMSVAGTFLLYAAVLLAVLGVLGSAFAADRARAKASGSFFEAGAWVAVTGIGLIVGRRVLAAGRRSNDGDPEARKELGRRLARTRVEFDRLLTSEGDKTEGEAAEPRRHSDFEQ